MLESPINVASKIARHRVGPHSDLSNYMEKDYNEGLSCLIGSLRREYQFGRRLDGSMAWMTFRPLLTSVKQLKAGWKIHISCSLRESPKVFAQLAQLVLLPVEPRPAFKVPADLDSARILNSGDGGATQVGKVITIYTVGSEDLDMLLRLSFHFAERLQLDGPQLVSDLTFDANGQVGMRYGAFEGVHTIDPVGRMVQSYQNEDGHYQVDDRSVSPTSIRPIPALVAKAYVPFKPQLIRTLSGRFTWIKISRLKGSPKGDVFLALRSHAPFDLCVIKTARRGVMGAGMTTSAQDLLKNEKTILEALAERDPGLKLPRVVDYQNSSSEHFLVMSDLRGSPYLHSGKPLDRRYIATALENVALLHRAGIIHRDLKPDNFLCVENRLIPIDFELASFNHLSDGPNGGTRGFFAPDSGFDVSLSRDFFALAGCLFYWVSGESPFTNASPAFRLANIVRALGYYRHARVIELLLEASQNNEAGHGDKDVLARLADFLRCNPRSRRPNKHSHKAEIASAKKAANRKWCLQVGGEVLAYLQATCLEDSDGGNS